MGMITRGKPGVTSATLSGATTLADNDTVIQRLNPNGTARTVTVQPQARGRGFLIVNTGTVAGINLSVVDKDAAAVLTIGPGESGLISGTGTGLVGISLAPGTTGGGSTLDIKGSVKAATVGSNITLAGSAPNTLDGVTLAANDRILVKDQSTGAQNGIYYVSTLGTGVNGTWTRATDADASSEVTTGLIVHVDQGTINADRWYTLTTSDVITLGTTALVFTQLPMYVNTENETIQVSGNSASNLTLALDAVNAGAGEGRLTLSADDQVNIDDGTANLQFDAGVVTETAMVSIDITPSGTMVMRGGGVSTFGDDTGFWSFDGAGALTTSGIVSAALTPSGAITLTPGAASVYSTLAITGGGAGSATAALTVSTGTRVKNDNNAGVPGSGALTIASGTTQQTTAAATGGASGAASLRTGATDVTFAAATGGASGILTVKSGDTDISAAVAATGGASGNALFGSGDALSTGATATSGASGTVTLESGTSADANTGGLTIRSGAPAATGTSGNVAISSGSASGAGTSGNISLTIGSAPGGTTGTIQMAGKVDFTTSGAVTFTGNPTINLGTGALTLGQTALSSTGALAWTLKANDSSALAIGPAAAASQLVFVSTTATPAVNMTPGLLTAAGTSSTLASSINHATANATAQAITVTAATTARTGGTYKGLSIAYTGLAGDTSGTTVNELSFDAPTKNGGSAVVTPIAIGAGYSMTIDSTAQATGENIWKLGANLASALAIGPAAAPSQLVFTSTTATPGIAMTPGVLTAAGTTLSIASSVTHATANVSAVALTMAATTTARTGGTYPGFSAAYTGLAGDTSGTTVSMFTALAPTKNGGSAAVNAFTAGAGFTNLFNLTGVGTGEANVSMAASLASAFAFVQSSTTYLTFATATAQIDGTVRMTTTDGVSSGTVRVIGGREKSLTASGTSLTNSASETVLASHSLPASSLKAGTILYFRARLKVTADNAGTTLTPRVRFGTTTLTGTVLAAGTAQDTAANDVWFCEGTITIRANPGASVACEGNGTYKSIAAAAGTGTYKDWIMEATNFATNGALLLELTGQWSAADANACQAECLNIWIM